MVSRGPANPHSPVPAVPAHGWPGAAACTGAILARVRDHPGWPAVSTCRLPLARDLTRAPVTMGRLTKGWRYDPGHGGASRTYPLDEWGPRLRWGLGGTDRRDPAQHRGDRARRLAGSAQGGRALAADRLRMRPRAGRRQLHRVVAQGRPG